jgi:hypothetical protein
MNGVMVNDVPSDLCRKWTDFAGYIIVVKNSEGSVGISTK